MSVQLSEIHNLTEIHNSDYSVIYEGYHPYYAQKVAFKLLKDEFPSLRSIARFNEEYEITHKSSFKAARRAIDKIKVGGRHVLVLEYIEGKSLKQVLEHNGLSLQQKVRLAVAVTQAIEEIHQGNIIHKDINPRNILIQENNVVKIIDFGISSRIQKQYYKPEAPEALEGTLAYIAPEQTGRMNHSVDYRADLYSLGVTLYELFTGKLPFTTTDQMELLHSHIAKQVPAMKGIPALLENIVLKLLAKNPEERYQTAFGLRKDLERTAEILNSQQPNKKFELGEYDFNATFYIPEKLYGRTTEVKNILATFNSVATGLLHLTLVGGYSGIGKTALINELYKPITEQRGYFIAGKFDQYQRDIPYSAIIQALKDFAAQILLEKESQIKNWRRKILSAIGNNGQVLIEVVPSLALVLGKQPPVPELPPLESQNRFNYVFQNFIKAISQE